MNDVRDTARLLPETQSALTPAALSELLRLTAPTGPVTVKGLAAEVRHWTKPGDSQVTRTYGRLRLGDASLRFELPPNAAIRDQMPLILHGALRVKATEGFRCTHEVVLIGDVVGEWQPQTSAPAGTLAALVRTQPRLSLEEALTRHGLDAFAFLSTGTAWGDLTTAASAVPSISQGNHVETNFMQPERFIADLEEVCRDPRIKCLVIARGGGAGLERIGDSHPVAAALLASGRAFFTALGHERDTLLLDKHADQPFPTPSILGQRLADALQDIEARRVQAAKARALSEQVNTLTRERDRLSAELRGATAALEARTTHQAAGAQDSPADVESSHSPFSRYVLGAVGLVVVFLLGRCTG